MGFWSFGRKKEDEEKAKTIQGNMDLPTAIMKNKDAIETLEKRQAHLEKRCDNLTEEAKRRIKNKDQEGAKLALRRKKMLELELTQLGNARLTLEQQINTLESQQTQQMAIIALSQGVEAQKHLTQSLNISSIDKLMEDLQDQQDRQQEVAQVLSQGVPLIEEEELALELNRLEEEELEKRLAEVQGVPSDAIGIPASLPEVVAASVPSMPQPIAAAENPSIVVGGLPSHGASRQKSTKGNTDDEELRKLEAELAM